MEKVCTEEIPGDEKMRFEQALKQMKQGNKVTRISYKTNHLWSLNPKDKSLVCSCGVNIIHESDLNANDWIVFFESPMLKEDNKFKFKVGDKVEFISPDSRNACFFNEHLTNLEIGEQFTDNIYRVYTLDKENCYFVHKDELQLVKWPKVFEGNARRYTVELGGEIVIHSKVLKTEILISDSLDELYQAVELSKQIRGIK